MSRGFGSGGYESGGPSPAQPEGGIHDGQAWNEVAGALVESVRSLYERIRGARGGQAVAEVREGLCTACNVLLRPQVYNEVRTNEAVQTCENCGRIMYYVVPVVAATGEPGDQGTQAAV